MPAVLWAIRNYKAVLLCVVIGSIAGYIWLLQGRVASAEKANEELTADLGTVQSDLESALSGIDNVNAALRQYQKWVAASLDSVKKANSKIAENNERMGKILDNLTIRASEARRIVDAPKIPFFMDVDVKVPAELISSDNGVFRFRMPTQTP